MSIKDMINAYIEVGYDYDDAISKVSQDIILIKIANSKFARNITIKGGVVMHSISNDIRRSTRDLDLDFIKYSLEDDSIKKFIDVLNATDDDIRIRVSEIIKPLHHQDYDGKRISLIISDINNYQIHAKLDIGVHKQFDIDQEEYCFNLETIKQSVNLLINSKEQIFTEKLKSLLKIGPRSTRYKDIFDFYYLTNMTKLDKKKLLNCINILIINDSTMREKTVQDICDRLNKILFSENYKNNLTGPKVNWLDMPINEAIENVLEYLRNIQKSNY